MENFDDLPSLGLDSLEDDEDSIEPLNPQVYSCISKIEGDDGNSFHGDVTKENGTGSEIKGQDTTHYQEPVAKPSQVYTPDSCEEIRNQLQDLETQQLFWQSYCIGNKHTVPLSEEEVDHIWRTQEFKDMVKQKVKTRKYGFTEDVEAVMIEFLQENDGRLPTADEFHSTWQSMRGTKGIVKLQEEKEAEKREKEAEKREKEAEKREKEAEKREKEAEKRERMRLEKENEVEKREKEAEKREKEAEKRERIRLQKQVEIEQRARMRLEVERMKLEVERMKLEQERMKLEEEYITEKWKRISLQNQMENEAGKRSRSE